MARPCCGVFIVILLKLNLGECEESSEETAQKEVLGDEYEQIFHSIPTLFEYVLEMLEERPEILEKDDITFFQEASQESCKGEVKREIKKCGDDSALNEDDFKELKRNIVTNDVRSTKIGKSYNNIGEIATDLQSTNSEFTTRGFEDPTNIIRHVKPKNNQIDSNDKPATKLKLKINKDNSQVKSNKVGKKYMKVKRNVSFGDSFFGLINWTKFYLSPEDVEEQALEIEQAIEDHNRKKQRRHKTEECTKMLVERKKMKKYDRYIHRGLKGLESAKVEGVRTEPVPTQSERGPDQKNNCMVGGAHAFILRISSFFGLAPLKFESKSNGFAVTITSAMCVYSYILVTILVICTIFGLVAEINVGVERSVRMSSRMSQVVSACDVLVVAATAGAGVYGAPRRMRNMLKFMDNVASVDKSIGGQYSIVTERKLCALLLAILIFFSVLLADDFCFYAMQAEKLDRQWDVVTNYIGFYLLWYVVVILELQFVFTALSVRARFQAVNDALALTARNVTVPLEKPRNSSPLNIYAIRVAPVESQRAADVSLLVDTMTSRDQPVIVRKTARGSARLAVSPCEAVRRLASLHGSLCEVVRRIDSSYGLPLVVVLISTLLHLIVTPYFLIMEIIVSTNRVHFLVLQFLWCLTHMLRMLVVVEPCHYTIAEGRRTENLICRLMNSAPSTGVLPTRLELFSRQLLLQSVSYSPMGMCTLDRPLVASVIGAVTTYLVILIQFQRYDS